MAVTGILGKKIGMTQVFDDRGEVHPITVLQAGPCVVTQLKTMAKDGYEAAQIGLVEFVKASRITKPQAGHLAKTEAPPVKFQREVTVEVARGQCGRHQGRRPRAGGYLLRCEVCGRGRDLEGTRICRRGAAASLRRRTQVARAHVSGAGFDRRFELSVAGFSRAEDAGTHGARPGDGAQSAYPRYRPGQNLLMVEGAVPGPRDGYVMIIRAKTPPRERRGFAGSGTVDPLKASKKATAKRK